MTDALYVDLQRGPYPDLLGLDHCWGVERDAKAYAGPGPVIAHPPCGPWGRLSHLCTRQDPECAIRAVEQVQRFGGVLEHPQASRLWKQCRLPTPGNLSLFAPGFTIELEQVRWGHPCRKATWLYFCTPNPLPPIPPARRATHCIDDGGPRRDGVSSLPHLPKSQRHLTPPAFARWLIDSVAIR
jgi:hypothetical protein